MMNCSGYELITKLWQALCFALFKTSETRPSAHAKWICEKITYVSMYQAFWFFFFLSFFCFFCLYLQQKTATLLGLTIYTDVASPSLLIAGKIIKLHVIYWVGLNGANQVSCWHVAMKLCPTTTPLDLPYTVRGTGLLSRLVTIFWAPQV